MGAKQLQFSSKIFRNRLDERVLWGTLNLVLASFLVITIATQFAPAPQVVPPSAAVQSGPDAASLSVASYLRAHGAHIP